MSQVFFFEMIEEVFHGSIIPTVATPRHGWSNVILSDQDIIIRLRSVLVPLVTVEDQSTSDLFFLFCQSEHVNHQLNRVALSKSVGHDETIVKIFDGGKTGPTLMGQDISDIGDPFLIGFCGCKIAIQDVLCSMIEGIFKQLLYILGFLAFERMPSLFIKRRTALWLSTTLSFCARWMVILR